MGSAALYALARRGLRVVGLERFTVGHDRGSSHGETRIIRRAYFEHPQYVPLVDEAMSAWRDIETESGDSLLRTTGLLLAGPSDGPVISGTRRAGADHPFAIEPVSPEACARSFAPIVLPEGLDVLFEPDAGLLYVDRCVRATARLARARGATIRESCRVRRWREDHAGVTVETSEGVFAADRIVITAGAWTGDVAPRLELPILVRRKVVLWFETREDRYRLDRGFPIFGVEHDGHFLYGFPRLGDSRMKLADHTGGGAVERVDLIDRSLHEEDVRRVSAFVSATLPGVNVRPIEHSICMYAMTPDDNFIVSRAPGHARVWIAAGFSGHGFKFAPVVGAVLADWLTDGVTTTPVEFLSWPRSAPRS